MVGAEVENSKNDGVGGRGAESCRALWGII